MRYLVIHGTLHADNRFTLHASHLADEDRGHAREVSTPVVAELLDAAGRLLARHPVAAPRGCSGGETSPDLCVRGAIPFHPATRVVRLARDGIQVHELTVSERGPEVRLAWTPPATARGRHEIAWEAHHPDGRPLQFFLRYSIADGEGGRRLGGRTSERRAVVDFDDLPGGAGCRLAIVASDGVNTAVAESAPFSVLVKPCRPLILGPADGAVVERGSPLRLRGQGLYLEEGVPERESLSWTSSRDGALGRGMVVDARLSPGEHRIELTAGTGARAGTASIRVTIAPIAP